MNIKKYIKSKKNINVYNLINSQEIISLYDLDEYTIFDSLDVLNVNPFLENQLFIFITKPSKLNKIFFNKVNGLNNKVMFVTNDDDFKNNATKYKKLLVSYGYKYHEIDDNDKMNLFIYDISEYKDNPDWLNSDNWANPDLWDK
tara:strand:+ start:2454 stop:2885 length:432 start_codon:yes stop_codon:yes gene_type:complete